MSKIVLSNVIKKGKLIDNYLVNFPLFINKEKNSIYKLVIGLSITCFVVDIPYDSYTIRLPYYLFTDEHAEFISWGDGITRRGLDVEFLEHTYETAGKYLIYILGNTPNLYSVYDYAELLRIRVANEQRLTELNNKLTLTPYLEEEKATLMVEHAINLERIPLLSLLQSNFFAENFDHPINYQYLSNFLYCLIDIKKLCDSLTDLRGVFKWYVNLSGIPDEPLPHAVSSCQLLFYACPNIKYLPFNFALPLEGTNFQLMFGYTGLLYIFNLNLRLPYKTENVYCMFRACKFESVPENLFNNVTSCLTNTRGMFRDCPNLMYFTSTKKLEYITDIGTMFQFCPSLKEVKMNLPNLTSLFATCWGCSSLNRIEGFHINLFTKNANYAFMDCYSLNQDISLILEYWADFNLTEICSTFYNCLLLRGTPKELYLWKSFTLGHLSTDMFYNCTLLNNYNFITKEWGGPDDVNYWYGSFEVQIENTEEDVYCLPIYKFLYGNNNTPENRSYNIFTNESGILAPYDFYINYGDESAWHHVVVGDTPFFNSFWLNDKNSPFFGYPKTWQVNYKSKYKNSNNEFEKQGDKIQALLTLLNSNFYKYIYRDIVHVYKQPGNYKIMIMGKIPRLYVHLDDYLTNRLLFDIYTVNKLPFTTLDHAFTNAINLRYLPNEQMKFFPILSGLSNWEPVQITLTYNNEECPLYKYYDEHNNIVLVLSSSTGYYYKNDSSWASWSGDATILEPLTRVLINSLTRLLLLHEIPTSGTEYTFAHVNGFYDYLNPLPFSSLFEINSCETTFANRKIKP